MSRLALVLALIILLVLIGIVVTAVDQAEKAAIQRRQRGIQYRARVAEQEINEISQRAQRAILDEAWRRAHGGPGGEAR